MSKAGNTMMAIPEKRSFGLSAKWIGIKFFTGLGIIAVTSQKVLRACAQNTEASCDSLTRDQSRSLVGFFLTFFLILCLEFLDFHFSERKFFDSFGVAKVSRIDTQSQKAP